MMQQFSLVPFHSEISQHNFTISGTISRCDRILSLHYQLEGDLEKLDIPVAIDLPYRKHELWQETCFEFFLKPQNASQYWEFNLSPSRDWNVYHFDDYRQGMQEEQRFTQLPFLVQKDKNCLSLEIEVNLDAIAASDFPLNVAISMVTKSKNGDIIYWALTHLEKQADFHYFDSFIILIQ